jgi:hypothetical protein
MSHIRPWQAPPDDINAQFARKKKPPEGGFIILARARVIETGRDAPLAIPYERNAAWL